MHPQGIGKLDDISPGSSAALLGDTSSDFVPKDCASECRKKIKSLLV